MDQSALAHRTHLTFQREHHFTPGTTVLTVTCPGCGTEASLDVETQPLEAWLSNRCLIQDGLPGLTEFQREQLITGYCQTCWDKMFLEENEDVPYWRDRDALGPEHVDD